MPPKRKAQDANATADRAEKKAKVAKKDKGGRLNFPLLFPSSHAFAFTFIAQQTPL